MLQIRSTKVGKKRMKTEVKEENNEYTLSIDREQHTGFDAESTAVALALHLHTCMHIAYVWRRVLVGVESAESVSVCTDARKMADDQIKALKRSSAQTASCLQCH